MGLIYHIASATDWEQARIDGDYRVSTRGKALDEQGYIHSSTARQVSLVANAVYQGLDNLLILVIREEDLDAEIRYEPIEGTAEIFPHIYGPINLGAVVRTIPFRPGHDGLFTFDEATGDTPD